MAKKKLKGKKRKKIQSIGCAPLALLGALAVLLIVVLIVSLSSCRQEEKAAGDALWDGGWYADELGRIEKDGPLVSGMKAFRRQVGLRPYLTILSGVEPEALDAYAHDQYEALFEDEGHLLVVYDEWGEDKYYLAAQVGPESDLSAEDRQILLDAMEQAYQDRLNTSYAEAFGAGFKAAAKRMQAGKEAGKGSVAPLFILAGVLVLLSGALVYFLHKRAVLTRQQGY